MISAFGSHIRNNFKHFFLGMKTRHTHKISAKNLVNPLLLRVEYLKVWVGARRLVIEM